MSKQIKWKDPQQINFIDRLEGENHEITMFFNIENSEEMTYKVLWTSNKNGNAKYFKSVKQFWKWILEICNKKMVCDRQWIKG